MFSFQRMGTFSDIKSWPIWFILFTYIFFVSTLIINFLQLCSLVIWPFDKTLYRKVNYNLSYLSWCRKCMYSIIKSIRRSTRCTLHVLESENYIESYPGHVFCVFTKIHKLSSIDCLKVQQPQWRQNRNAEHIVA